jgi:hypothetical protein
MCQLNLAENGPYQDKAKAIYKELRSNLIRYYLRLFGTEVMFKAIGWFLKQCIPLILQKYGSQLPSDWIFVGAVRSG